MESIKGTKKPSSYNRIAIGSEIPVVKDTILPNSD
jgi:hypothetical protein